MRLYLVRHGQAAPGADDAARTLTAAGRAEVEAVADVLRSRGVRVGQIRHSGLARARETAEILAAALGLTGGVGVNGALTPEADPREAAALLADVPDSSVLVGHLPHLARLASFLVALPGADPITFHPGTAVCLERDPTRWTTAWILDPPAAGRRP